MKIFNRKLKEPKMIQSVEQIVEFGLTDKRVIKQTFKPYHTLCCVVSGGGNFYAFMDDWKARGYAHLSGLPNELILFSNLKTVTMVETKEVSIPEFSLSK